LKSVHFVGLHYIIVSQCMVQKTLRSPIISAFYVAEGTFLADVFSYCNWSNKRGPSVFGWGVLSGHGI